MTRQEYLNKFNLFYNNASNIAPGLEVSEIEDITNQVLKEIIITTYSNNYEQTEEVRRYLDTLNKEAALTLTISNNLLIGRFTGYEASLPSDIWYITVEKVGNILLGSSQKEVVPITRDTLHRVLKNPFRCPTKKRALRVDVFDNDSKTRKVLIIMNGTKDNGDSYLVSYLAAPETITLSSSLTSELGSIPEQLQVKLLEASVETAKRLWSNN